MRGVVWVLLRTVRIGVPTTIGQQRSGERRVAVTPDVAGRLIKAGHEVVVETGAGTGAGHADAEYEAAGATVAPRAETMQCDLLVVVDPPPSEEVRARAVLGLLRPFDDVSGIADLATTNADLFAFEAVPRTTRAQSMDVLSSQATASGYHAVLQGAVRIGRFFPMLTTAAGTIRPAAVLVLGAGVAGLQAIATARRLGAAVSAFDVRAAAAEQVESLGARFIEFDMEAQDATATGGYAQELQEAQQARVVAALAPHVAKADVVVSTAAIPGRPAPRLIDRSGVEAMRPGSVIVDAAASTGGNCEVTIPGETVTHAGVTVVGDLDLASGVATHASQMYGRNAAAFLALVTGEDGSYQPDWTDDIVTATCVARDGRLTHPRLADVASPTEESS